MKMGNFLLDTNIILHLLRDSPAFQAIDKRYNLTNGPFKPTVCVVTSGEIRAIAYRRGWGQANLKKLGRLLSNLVVVDINDKNIIETYARISAHATANGWALHSQKNDLWIAAVASVTKATLLTTDHDFSEANGIFLKSILLDANTGAEIN